MATKVHFINVGQGNMILLRLANGENWLYDCNVTSDNENNVLSYLAKQIGWHTEINTFVCSHREADHMRGVKKVHEYFPTNMFGTLASWGRLQIATNIRNIWSCAVMSALQKLKHENIMIGGTLVYV